MRRVRYILQNWKIVYHLLVGTKRFGVNNKWWERKGCSWLFGMPLYRQIIDIVKIYPILRRYRMLKFRAISLGFIHPDNAELLWGK